MTKTCTAAIALLILCSTSNAFAAIILGVVGDSLSDEYAEETYDYAQNWVQQLAAAGVADLGPTAAGQPGGTWGDSRRTGYEHNWARAGAVTADLQRGGQVAGLTATTTAKGITHVVAAIGANDFFPYPMGSWSSYEAFYNSWSSLDDPFTQQMISDNMAVADWAAQMAIDNNPNDGRFVLANIPDYGMAPFTWGYAGYDNGEQRELVTTVIKEVNRQIAELADTHHVPLVDLFSFSKAVFGENTDPRAMDPTVALQLGGVDIFVHQIDTPTNTNPQAGFVDDGIHPHTTVQGVMANLFVEAFNLGYGESTPLFTEEQILTHAGLDHLYGGSDTLFGQLAAESYADFIILPSSDPTSYLTWNNQGGAGNSNWATPANWAPAQTPDENAETTIANGDTVRVDSPGQAAKSVALESGTLHVASGGELAVAEDVGIQSDGTLQVDVGATTSLLEVTGALDLSAVGNALLLRWQPDGPGSEFGGDYVVVTYGSLDGAFGNVGGGSDPYSIPEAYIADVEYEEDNQITVSLHSLLAGDADLYGDVDFGDYMILEAAFGGAGQFTDGDFDLDGDVDFGDYMILEAAFGESVPVASAAAIPEPGTLAMLLGSALVGLVVLGRRRRKTA